MNTYTEHAEAWTKIAAAIPASDIQWRVDGKPTARDGKFFARFVAYVDAQFVRERLDSVVPGNWDLTLELLPPIDIIGQGGEIKSREFSFKARLQVLGVIREDIGTGDDYKTASSDAFKRAAVRFGIAHELYAYEQNWVQVDGEGKYAKPLVDPQTAYIQRYGSGAKSNGAGEQSGSQNAPTAGANGVKAATPPASVPPASTLTDTDAVSCPKCGGEVWDNRLTKRNPRAPNFKCKNRGCDGAIWPPKEEPAPIATGGVSTVRIIRDEDEESLPF